MFGWGECEVGEFSLRAHRLRGKKSSFQLERKLEKKVEGSEFDMKLTINPPHYLLMLLLLFFFFFFFFGF